MYLPTKLLATLIAVLCVTTTTLGASYRIDFSGSTLTPNENFSGYAILDYSVVDTDNSPDQGTYIGLVTHIELQINGMSFVMSSTAASGDGVVFNDDVFYGDRFSFSSIVESTTDASNTGLFLLQLGDTSNSIFSDTSLPTGFTLSDFDPYNSGIFSTGVFLPTSGSTIVPLEFVQISQVPLPGGLLLLLSGLTAIFGFRFSSLV